MSDGGRSCTVVRLHIRDTIGLLRELLTYEVCSKDDKLCMLYVNEGGFFIPSTHVCWNVIIEIVFTIVTEFYSLHFGVYDIPGFTQELGFQFMLSSRIMVICGYTHL